MTKGLDESKKIQSQFIQFHIPTHEIKRSTLAKTSASTAAIRFRKSPEPTFTKKGELKQSTDQISYLATNYTPSSQNTQISVLPQNTPFVQDRRVSKGNSKQTALKSKRSVEKLMMTTISHTQSVKSNQKNQHTKESTAKNSSIYTTIDNSNQGKSRQSMGSALMINKTQNKGLTNLITFRDNSGIKNIARKRSAEKLKLEENDNEGRTSKITGPQIVQHSVDTDMGSPRITIQLIPSNNGSSIFATTDNSNNAILNYPATTRERKISMSAQLAPKVKKKRKGTQKQPKQTTQIQLNQPREFFNPSIIQSQSSYRQFANHINQPHPHQNPSNLSPGIINQTMTNQSIASTFKGSSSNHDNYLQHFSQTPTTQFYEFEDLSSRKPQAQIIQFDDYSPASSNNTQLRHQANENQNIQSSNIQNSPKNQMFSFHVQKQTGTIQHNNQVIKFQKEESKEVIGIFGGTHRFESLSKDIIPRSIEQTSEKKKKTFEIPTPVFQAERCQSNFRASDNTSVEKIRSISQQIQEEEIINPSVIPNLQVSQTNQSSKVTQKLITKEDIQTLNLKKVQSTSNLNHRNPLPQNDILHNSKINTSIGANSISNENTKSTGNLFSKLKSFIWKTDNLQNSRAESDIIPKVFYRCQCGFSDKPYACIRAMTWLDSDNVFQEFEYGKNKQLYDDLLKLAAPSGSESQIERDISRTFTTADPYMNVQEGQQQLSRVLNVFSKYDTSIGYVQGMNFLVGSMLMHCSEEVAFWLFVSLIEDYEMRDIYQPKLPGLYKHSQMLQLIQMEHLNPLYQHFSKHNILVEMYASDWIFTLFSNIIPIQKYHLFLEQFFIGGWSFFYKFALSFLKSLQEDLLDCEDISEILSIIKLKHTKSYIDTKSDNGGYNTQRGKGAISDNASDTSPIRIQYQSNGLKGVFNKYILGKEEKITSESYKDDNVWEKIVELSIKEWEEEFNEGYILNLLSNFDPEKLVFKQSFANTPQNNSPSQKDRSSHKRNSSLPSNSKSFSKDSVMPRFDLMKEQRIHQFKQQQSANQQNNIPFSYNDRGGSIAQQQRTYGSLAPQQTSNLNYQQKQMDQRKSIGVGVGVVRPVYH